jgi:hypothetical protein
MVLAASVLAASVLVLSILVLSVSDDVHILPHWMIKRQQGLVVSKPLRPLLHFLAHFAV